jgi:DNA repair protein RadA
MKRCGGPKKVSFVEAIYKHQEQLEKRHLCSDFTRLNQIIGNGFEAGFYYLMYGSSRIINSILLSMAVAAQSPEEGGLGSSVIFIDNDNIFNPYTLIRLAHSLKLNPNSVLSRIFVARAFIWNHLGEIVNNLESLLEEGDARLVLISGLTTLFEGDYERRKNQMLLEITNKLRNIAVDKKVIVTVSTALAKGSATKPAGGKIIAHTPHVLIRVIQQGERITFDLMKHPSRPAVQTVQWLARPQRAPHTRSLDHFLKPPLER